MGGRARTYVIERRERPESVDDEAAGDSAFSLWRQVELAFDPTITVKSQPRGQQLEYRVIALSRGGPSPPATPSRSSCDGASTKYRIPDTATRALFAKRSSRARRGNERCGR